MCVRFYRFCRTQAVHHPLDRRQHGQPAQGSHLVGARHTAAHLRPHGAPSAHSFPLPCLQFQPDRRPLLRVLREALRETADGRGGDLRLRRGVSGPPADGASTCTEPVTLLHVHTPAPSHHACRSLHRRELSLPGGGGPGGSQNKDRPGFSPLLFEERFLSLSSQKPRCRSGTSAVCDGEKQPAMLQPADGVSGDQTGSIRQYSCSTCNHCSVCVCESARVCASECDIKSSPGPPLLRHSSPLFVPATTLMLYYLLVSDD